MYPRDRPAGTAGGDFHDARVKNKDSTKLKRRTFEPSDLIGNLNSTTPEDIYKVIPQITRFLPTIHFLILLDQPKSLRSGKALAGASPLNLADDLGMLEKAAE